MPRPFPWNGTRLDALLALGGAHGIAQQLQQLASGAFSTRLKYMVVARLHSGSSTLSILASMGGDSRINTAPATTFKDEL